MNGGGDGPVVDVVAQSMSLHLSDRLAHKNWKVREAAYSCLTAKLAAVVPIEEGEKIPAIVSEHFLPLGKKYLKDANAAAHLGAMETAIRMVSVMPSSMVAKFAPDVVKGLIEKAFSSRPGNKAKSTEVIAELVAADAAETTVNTLIAVGFAHKVPKIVVATVEALGQVIERFGCAEASIPIKELAVGLRKLLEHGNGDIRRVTKALLVEIARWIGGATAMRPLLKDVKDVIVRELEASFEENTGHPVPIRLTRQAELQSRQAQVSDDQGTDFAAHTVPIDLGESVDLMAKLQAFRVAVDDDSSVAWATAVESKKWNIRKASMDAIVDIADGSRIETGDLTDLTSKIRKIVAKDVNVNVTASAAKAISALSTGLGTSMHPAMARHFFVDLLSRLKEKNRIALEAVFNALENMHSTGAVKLADVFQDVCVSTAHKVPKARELTLVWLLASLKRSSATEIKPLFKDLCNLLIKCSDDTSGEVRDEALGGFARISVVMGPRICGPFLERLDKVKQDKVTLLISQSDQSQTSSQAPPQVSKAPIAKPLPPAADPVPIKPPALSPVKRKAELAVEMDSDELAIVLEKNLVDVTLEGFLSKSFKNRSDEAEKMSSQILELEKLTVMHVSMVLSCVSIGLGLRDSNPLSLNSKMRLVQTMAQQSTGICVSPLVDEAIRSIAKKLGDIKSAMIAKETLLTVAESVGPLVVFEIVDDILKEEKNPRTMQSMCSFIDSLCRDFGISLLDEERLLSTASAMLDQEASAIRKATISLMCSCALRMGGPEAYLSKLNSQTDVSDKFLAELAKREAEDIKPTRSSKSIVAVQSPSPRIPHAQEKDTMPAVLSRVAPEPKVQSPPKLLNESKKPAERRNGSRPASLRLNGTPKRLSTKSDRSVEPERTKNVESSVPLQQVGQFDVDLALASNFVSALDNKEWSIRHKHLKELLCIVSDVDQNLVVLLSEDLLRAVVGRTADPNRNIAATAYEVLAHLGILLKDSVVPRLKFVVPVILTKGLLDSKKTVHKAALGALESWTNSCGIHSLLSFIPVALTTENSMLRRTVIEWTIKQLEATSFDASTEDMNSFVVPTLSCLRDKVADVRQLAERLLSYVVESVGITSIMKATRTLPETQRLKLKPLLEKYGAATETPHKTRLSAVQTPTSRRSIGSRSRTPSTRGTPPRSDFGRGDSSRRSTPNGSLANVGQPSPPTTPSVRRLELGLTSQPSPMDIDQGRIEPPTPSTELRQRPPENRSSAPTGEVYDFTTKVEYFQDESPEKETLEDFAARRNGSMPPRSANNSAVRRSLPTASTSVPLVSAVVAVEPLRPPSLASRPASPQEKVLVRDRVIHHLASDELETRLDGVRLLAEGLQMAESKVHPRASEIVLSLVSLLSDAFHAIECDKRSERAIKYVLNGLMQMFQRVALARACDQMSIRILFGQLFHCLTSDKVRMLQQGDQVAKALNHLTLKAVENSNQGYLFTSLVEICDELVRSRGPDVRRQVELSIKCMLRMSSGLRSLDPEEILRDIHWFLDRNLVGQGAGLDNTCHSTVRSLQQIAVQLFEIYGPTLRNKMALVPSETTPQPLVTCWVEAMIENKQRTTAGRASTAMVVERPRSGGDSADPQNQGGGTDELRRIFSMIGQKASSQDGIQELHKFKLRNPEVNIEPYLQKTSAVFQRYIYQGLEAIDANAERQARLLHSSNGSAGQGVSTPSRKVPPADDYLQKLQEMQQKYSTSEVRTKSLTEKENRPGGDIF